MIQTHNLIMTTFELTKNEESQQEADIFSMLIILMTSN